MNPATGEGNVRFRLDGVQPFQLSDTAFHAADLGAQVGKHPARVRILASLAPLHVLRFDLVTGHFQMRELIPQLSEGLRIIGGYSRVAFSGRRTVGVVRGFVLFGDGVVKLTAGPRAVIDICRGAGAASGG